MKFYGTNKDGKVIVKGQLSVKEYIDSLEGDFEIKITPVKNIRSLEMNNLYFWWIGLLVDQTGYSKQELHSYFKMKLLCIEDTVQGEKILNCQSTSDLTIKEFGEYLEGVGRITAEVFNYYLPSQLQ